MVRNATNKIQYKYELKNNIPTCKREAPKKVIKIRKFPARLPLLLRVTYSSKCIEHYHICSTTHMRQVHGVNADYDAFITTYEKKPKIIRSRINSIIKIVSAMVGSEGKARGKKKRIIGEEKWLGK